MSQSITVATTIHAPITKVWEMWNEPQHITHWAFAADSWEAPYAENDVREGGRFKTTMAAKDGSDRFDFTGVYNSVVPQQYIAYTMDDGRTATIAFTEVEEGTKVEETFELENENSEELQRTGWQAILDNFKKYVEET